MNVIFGKVYVHFNDSMFYVKRIISEQHEPNLEVWREHLYCDTVLKKEGKYYFCQKIQDVEVIEDEQI